MGSATAQLNLSNNYNRDGDYKKALEMWLKATEQGEPQAQFNVGVFYYNGVESVVEKDLNKAFEWFTRSKEGGFE